MIIKHDDSVWCLQFPTRMIYAACKSLLSIHLLLVAAVVMDCTAGNLGEEHGKSEVVFCDVSNNSTINECTVFRANQSLVLNCSIYSGGRWYKNGSLKSICPAPVCTLTDLSFLENNGLYYCIESNRKHYVNIDILSPPEFLPLDSSGMRCYGGICNYPEKSAYVDKSFIFDISVKVTGKGPFSVSWHHNSLSSVEACPPSGSHNTTVECIAKKLNEIEWKFTYLLKDHLKKWMSGKYFAMVSNPYGQNISETVVAIGCNTNPSPPIPLMPSTNITRKLFKGQSTTLSCSMKMSKIDKLGICYMNKHQSIKEILNNEDLYYENCALCINDNANEECEFQIPNRTKWIAKRYQSLYLNDCPVNHTVELQMESLDTSDSLKFQCFYLINNEGENGTFDVGYEVIVIGISIEEISAITIVSAVILIALLVIVLVMSKIHKRKKEKLKKQEESLSSFDSGICRSDDDMSTISEGSYLRCNEHINNDYGTIFSAQLSLDSRKNSHPYKV